MTDILRIWTHAALIGAIAVLTAPAGAAQAPPAGEPLAVESTALVPLDTESSVSIFGLRGQLSIETQDKRELRVVSRGIGPGGAEIPVGIWQDGLKMIVAPAPGAKDVERQLHVEVPRGFSIAIEAADSDVIIQAGSGVIDLRGKGLRVTVQGGTGALATELEGGSLSVRDANDATFRLRGTTADVSALSGNVNVHATGGSVSLSKIDGSVDVESEECTLVLEGMNGMVHVKARKGEAKVVASKSGAEFEMTGSQLHLKEGKGDITVTSDASVDFLDMAASMHFDMYGGTLRGKGNQGILEVRTRNTEVNVESIEQGMRVQGDGLKAKIVDVGGELYVETTLSDVAVDRAGSVIVRLDRGNVSVQRASGPVSATVTGGDVHIIDGIGPVTLDLDGGDAEVSWASIGGDKDSQLVNKSGSITARFPVSGSCRIEAKSKYGRIDSDLPTVKVMDDLSEAQGPVNGGYRPIVRIVSNRDIRLQDGSKAHDAN